MTSSTPLVAVAIVGYRNAADIEGCLKALALSTYARFEVVVCENGGPDAFAALTRALPGALPGGQTIRLIQAARNGGFAGGVNICLAATPDAEAWWVLNPDTEPHPEALGRQVARLGVGDRDAVGCILYRPNGRIQSYGGRWRPWLARAESIGIGKGLDEPVDAARVERAQTYLNGASMLLGRRFLEAAGPMREDYFLYCEEVEWCLRAQRLGMRLGFAPEARVLHLQGTTTGAAEAIRLRPRTPIFLAERNQMLLTRDCFPARLPVAALSALGLMVLRYARRGAWRQLGYAFQGWRAGLRNERGPPAWVRTDFEQGVKCQIVDRAETSAP